MRTSLLPGLLEALRRARRRGETRARLFTLGSCFGALVTETAAGTRPRLAADVGSLPREELRFAAVLAGTRHEYLSLKPEEVDVYDAKGLAVELIERVTGKLASVRLSAQKPAHLHPRGALSQCIRTPRHMDRWPREGARSRLPEGDRGQSLRKPRHRDLGQRPADPQFHVYR